MKDNFIRVIAMAAGCVVASVTLGVASPRLDAAWDLFLDVCPRAVTDLPSVADTLPVPGPIGEKVFFVTEDGTMTLIDTLMDDIQVSIEEFTLANRIHRDCSFAVTGDGSGDPELSVATQRAVYQRRISPFEGLDIAGGRLDQEIPFGPPMNWIMPDQGNDLYVIHGLVPGTDALAYVTLGTDILHLHLTHSFPEEHDQ